MGRSAEVGEDRDFPTRLLRTKSGVATLPVKGRETPAYCPPLAAAAGATATFFASVIT